MYVQAGPVCSLQKCDVETCGLQWRDAENLAWKYLLVMQL